MVLQILKTTTRYCIVVDLDYLLRNIDLVFERVHFDDLEPLRLRTIGLQLALWTLLALDQDGS